MGSNGSEKMIHSWEKQVETYGEILKEMKTMKKDNLRPTKIEHILCTHFQPELIVKDVQFENDEFLILLSNDKLSEKDIHLLFNYDFRLVKPYAPWKIKYNVQQNEKNLTKIRAEYCNGLKMVYAPFIKEFKRINHEIRRGLSFRGTVYGFVENFLVEKINKYSEGKDKFILFGITDILDKDSDKVIVKIESPYFDEQVVRHIEFFGFECVEYYHQEYVFEYSVSRMNDRIKKLENETTQWEECLNG